MRSVLSCWSALLLGFTGVSSVYAEPVKLIIDTDIDSDCDDVGALGVAHALADEEKVDLLAVVINRKGLAGASAACTDVVNTFYGRPDIPIGTDKDGAKVKYARMSSFTGQLRDAFPHDIPGDAEAPDSLDVYRKTLAAQEDGSVVICSIGALSNLEDLMNSEPDQHSKLNGMELIQAKVKELIVMGGDFRNPAYRETNIVLDVPAAQKVAADWPGPVLWQGFEVGRVIITGFKLKEKGDDNPLKLAFSLRPFRGRMSIDRGKCSYDQVAVLTAIEGIEQEYYKTRRGSVSFDDEAKTIWKNDRKGRDRYLLLKTDGVAAVEDRIEELMSREPKH